MSLKNIRILSPFSVTLGQDLFSLQNDNFPLISWWKIC